ncbi:MAG: hypothetical protein OEM67_08685 [Thermoleophilia bacterium]|nr:hypothetical protein [Thermoleophilia bacterium]MDH3724279.1 hypothetical protein [Thermoleophilia bacterium]
MNNDDPFEGISAFFDSPLWSIASLLLQVFFILLWAALVYWTYQDAKRRIREPAFIAGSVALSLLIPYLGAIIYLIIRPPEYLVEERERELELLALEQRLAPDDAEGHAMVGRLLDREGGGELEAGAFSRALTEAGVARSTEMAQLEERVRDLEFRLRVASGASPEEARAEGDDTGRWRRPSRRRGGDDR